MARSMVETCVKRRRLHRGDAVDFYKDVVRLPDGNRATREYLGHPGAVAVVPFLDPDTVVLVRQFRYPVGKVTYEIPAGKLDGKEPPRRCVERELREETGYTARRVERLLSFWPTPAFANELLHIYRAEGLAPGRMTPDHDEFIEAVRVPFRKALGWALSGRIRDAKTIIALLACAQRRQPGRRARRH